MMRFKWTLHVVFFITASSIAYGEKQNNSFIAPSCSDQMSKEDCDSSLSEFIYKHKDSSNPLIIREVNKAYAEGYRRNLNNGIYYSGIFDRKAPKIDIHSLSVEKPKNQPAQATFGEWRTLQITGKKDGITREVRVYLPAEYKDKDAEKLPVLYYFHGYSMSPAEAEMIPMNHLMELARTTGIAKPFVVVAPDLKVGFGLDSPKTDGEKSESFLLEDVMPTVEAQFNLDSSQRMAMGNSMGGFVSLNLASKHPGLFKEVAAHEPMLFRDPKWLHEKEVDSEIDQMKKWRWIAREGMANLRGLLPDNASFANNNPIENLAKLPKEQRPRIFVSTGDKDDFHFYEGATILKEKLASAGDKSARISIRPGDDHDWQIVAKGMLSALTFLGEGMGAKPKSEFGRFLVDLESEGKLFPILSYFVNNNPIAGAGALANELKKRNLQLSPEDIALLKNLLSHPQLDLPPQAKIFAENLESLKFSETRTGEISVNLKLTPAHCDPNELLESRCHKDRLLIPLPTEYWASERLAKVLRNKQTADETENQMLTLAQQSVTCQLDIESQLQDLNSKVIKLRDAVAQEIEFSKGSRYNPYVAELSPNVQFKINYSTQGESSKPTLKLTGIQGVNIRLNSGWPASSVSLWGFETDGRKQKVIITKFLIPIALTF